MFIYLLALPIWNFILPTYAFWHFDDFSWGETRVIEGEKRRGGCKEGDHGSGGVMKVMDTGLVLKSWEEWEAERRMVLESRRRREMARRALLSENVVGK
jgi:chitin synthase